ncbi:hypothetical protein SAEN8230_06560 [Salmonella enterica subsp. arizonae]
MFTATDTNKCFETINDLILNAGFQQRFSANQQIALRRKQKLTDALPAHISDREMIYQNAVENVAVIDLRKVIAFNNITA